MWRLKIIKGAELADKLVTEVTLPQPFAPGSRFVIGRDPANAWVLTDRTLAISARHCEIVATPAGPVLRDLSTNGTFVNAQASRLAGEHLLADGDHIELGPFTIAISGPPLPVLGAVRPLPAAPARTPGVAETAPQRPPPSPMPMRGGDPAAMLAAGGGFERVGLTEILRAAPKADDSSVDVTKIRLAPAKAPASPAPVPAPVPKAPAPPAPPSLPEQLAQAANLASSALRVLNQRHAGAVPAAALQPLLAALHRGDDPVAAVRRWAADHGIQPLP